jgi:F-type H+-transporting ATPase subunit delta
VSHAGDDRVARRYAGALFGAASRHSKTDAVQRDLESLAGLWQTVPLLRQALENPLIPAGRKMKVIDDLFRADLDPLTRSFLHLLVEKRREGILPMVERDYRTLADEARGLVRAHATVAADLDPRQRDELLTGLRQRTGKQIELQVHVEPAILGGVVVRLGDTVIDGSVRGALERLREQMLVQR